MFQKIIDSPSCATQHFFYFCLDDCIPPKKRKTWCSVQQPVQVDFLIFYYSFNKCISIILMQCVSFSYSTLFFIYFDKKFLCSYFVRCFIEGTNMLIQYFKVMLGDRIFIDKQ